MYAMENKRENGLPHWLMDIKMNENKNADK